MFLQVPHTTPEDIHLNIKDCDVAFMNAKHSRSAIRKDYDDKIEKVRVENKETKDSLNTEIQNLNISLTAVKTDTAEIKGMISTLLNK